jgi:hypothetical protein
MKMASRVVVACPTCETVRVPPDQIWVQWCIDTDGWTYRSRCPKCRSLLHSPTSERLASVVLGMGAQLESWSLPAELNERPSGPPLTPVDLLELHLLLLEPDWFDQLRATGSL